MSSRILKAESWTQLNPEQCVRLHRGMYIYKIAYFLQVVVVSEV